MTHKISSNPFDELGAGEQESIQHKVGIQERQKSLMGLWL